MKIIANILPTIAIIAAFTVNVSAYSEEERGGKRKGPPPEAIEACEGKEVDSACTVDTPEGELEGTCKASPKGDMQACVPEGHKPRGGKNDRGEE